MKGTSLLFVLAQKRFQNVEIERSDAALILATIWPVQWETMWNMGGLWKNTGKYGSKAMDPPSPNFAILMVGIETINLHGGFMTLLY